MIIAVDGPAGAGKSTVCRILAGKLGFLYLDTGAMYRALAWALRQQEKDSAASDEIARLLPDLPLRFSIGEDCLEIFYNGARLDEEIRSPDISDAASRISRLESVRSYLLAWQRRLSEQGNIVAEGRDTGTVVFPNADLKVFLTASLTARIKRRRDEYLTRGLEIDPEEMERQIRERDEADANRALAPMRPAEDAVLLDTSDLDILEVVETLIEKARNAATRS